MNLSHRDFLDNQFVLIDANAVQSVSALRNFQIFNLQPRELRSSHGDFPCLIELAGNESLRLSLLDEFDRLVVPGEPHGLMALLKSDQSVTSVIGHLQRAMLKRMADGKRFWLRMHDPRVFTQLSRILSPAQLGELIGPIAEWRWLDIYVDEWRSTTGVYKGRDFAEVWSISQWEAVFRVELLNRVAQKVVRDVPILFSNPHIYDHIDAAIVRVVDGERFTRLDDQLAFTVDAVVHGFDLFTHPVMQQCLAEVRHKNASYLGCVAGLDLVALSRSVGGANGGVNRDNMKFKAKD